jgi:hypothetical protein
MFFLVMKLHSQITGKVNTRNVHYWAAENLRWLRQVEEHQRQWSVNIWYGVNGNRIIGPYFIEGNLNDEIYAAFLLNILPLLLEDIPLRNRMRMWYQHDGCPAHNATVARNVLNREYPGRGLVVVDQKRGPLVQLTSHHWIFFCGEL